MKKIQDMTKGNLWGQIFLFGLPFVFSNLLQILFNMSDVAIVGKFAGTAALGAVGSTTTFVALFTEFLIGVGCGINAITAKYYGAKDSENLGLRYLSEPVQMRKKRTSTASKHLIICPIFSHRFSLYLHIFTNLRP